MPVLTPVTSISSSTYDNMPDCDDHSTEASLCLEEVVDAVRAVPSPVRPSTSPLKDLARQWSVMKGRQIHPPEEPSGQVELLRSRCKAAEEQQAAAEQRVISLEGELTALKSLVGFIVSGEGSSELAALQAAVTLAHKETSALWDEAAKTITEPMLLHELQLKDAAWRLQAQVQLEEQRREEIWESLRAGIDASAFAELARAVGGGPVSVARRLFDVPADVLSASSSRHSGSPLRKISQPEAPQRIVARPRRASSGARLDTQPSEAFSDAPARGVSRGGLPPRPRLSTTVVSAVPDRGAPAATAVLLMPKSASSRDDSPSVKDRVRALEMGGKIA